MTDLIIRLIINIMEMNMIILIVNMVDMEMIIRLISNNQYSGNGYDHTDSQYGRYGYDHQADNQYVNGYDHADYQYSGNERNHRADDEYGGCRVIKQIMKDMGSLDASVAMKDTIFVVMIAITSEKIIRVTLTRSNQKKTNSLEGMV